MGFQLSNTSNNVPCKDDSDGSGAFAFHDPDKVKEAINQLAQETSLQDFLDILDASGIKQLTEKEKEITWFEAQLVDEIPLIDDISTTSKENISYPSQWKLGDPVDEMDLLLTLQTLPKILPGISTKKWEKQYSNLALDEPINSDLLLVIDTSGSMGKIIEKGSRLYESVLASFGFVKYFENKGAEIALVNFSTGRRVEPWSKDYNLIKESLLFAWGQGTEFPINDIINLVKTKKENSVILIMTDGEINNWEMAFELFKELLLLENKIFLFLMGNDSNIENYRGLKKYGGFVHSANTMKEIRNIVYNEIL